MSFRIHQQKLQIEKLDVIGDPTIFNNTAVSAPNIHDDSWSGFNVGSRWINNVTQKEYVSVSSTVGAAVWVETTNNITPIKNSTNSPTVNDDISLEYTPGWIWINSTLATSYICISNDTGSAVWKEITSTGGGSNTTVDTISPTVNDDINSLFSPGWIWINSTLNNSYVCISNTSGNALWKEITGGGVSGSIIESSIAPTVDDDDTKGFTPGGVWIDTTLNNSYICISNSTGSAIWKETTEVDTVRTITSSGENISITDYMVVLNFSVGFVTLPTISELKYGKKYIIVKEGNTGNIEVKTAGSDTIDDGVSDNFLVVNQYDKFIIISNGISQWYSI